MIYAQRLSASVTKAARIGSPRRAGHRIESHCNQRRVGGSTQVAQLVHLGEVASGRLWLRITGWSVRGHAGGPVRLAGACDCPGCILLRYVGRLNRRVLPVRRPTVLKVTAVDARTGEFVVFDSAGEAGLVDAVGASCAVPGVWPPVTIGNRRFVDGGVRSVANADLAARYERVVIVAPVAQGTGPLMPGPGRQAAALAAAGARVALVRPDRAAMRAIGRNVLDVSRRGAAASSRPGPGHSRSGRGPDSLAGR